jgi:putative transposase
VRNPDFDDILQVYVRFLPQALAEYMQKQAGVRKRRGIYAVIVVFWLMIVQRLKANAALSSCVQELTQGRMDALLPDCKRVREQRISPRTGALCRARQRLPTTLVRDVGREIFARVEEQLRETLPAVNAPVLLLDGSSVQLEHCPALLKQFPPGGNQHGTAHWPVIRMVVMHDLGTGLAHHPCWGPMYGAAAVSEQELAERNLAQVSAEAVIMADRNFGVFSIAWAAHKQGHPVLLRLSEPRAKRLAGRAITHCDAWPVVWRPSRWDRSNENNPSWPEEAAVAGTFIAWRVGKGKSKQWLYLFTTVAAAPEDLVQLYGRRWNIETDLRSLKQTVRLNHITARSLDMVEKELLMAVAAYNLVRTVMAMAARQARLDPRQLSFTNVLYAVQAAWPELTHPTNVPLREQTFQRVLDTAARCRLPNRPNRRSYPRAQWSRGERYPSRKSSDEKSK